MPANRAPAPRPEVVRLVLVHSPLVGPQTWEPVAAEFRALGYEAVVPDLTGTVAGGPPYAERQAEVIAESASGAGSVLVGHSGAGALLAPAGALVASVAGFVFVDAGLPAPGRSALEGMPAELAGQLRGMADGQGWLPPWAQWWEPGVLAELVPDAGVRRRFADACPRLPLAMFEERYPEVPGWPSAPAAYLRLSEAYEDEAAGARALGWPVTELASHHLAPLTDPGLVTAALLDLVQRLGS